VDIFASVRSGRFFCFALLACFVFQLGIESSQLARYNRVSIALWAFRFDVAARLVLWSAFSSVFVRTSCLVRC